MRHGGMLMRLAGVCAVLGITLSVAGFCLGGRLTSMRVYWDHGGPRVEYRDMSTASAEASSIPPDEQAAYDYGDASADSEAVEQLAEDEPGNYVSAPGEVQKLKVECAANVTIMTGDEWGVWREGDLPFTHKYDANDREWKIEAKAKRRAAEYAGEMLYITVPSDCVLEELDIEVGAGTLYVESITCGVADIQVGAGEAVMSGFSCANGSDWEVGAGTITADDSRLTGKVDIECGMGSVTLNLDRPENYGYEVESAMGSVTIDGEQHSGIAVSHSGGTRRESAGTYFDVECGMGSVEIFFND